MGTQTSIVGLSFDLEQVQYWECLNVFGHECKSHEARLRRLCVRIATDRPAYAVRDVVFDSSLSTPVAGQ